MGRLTAEQVCDLVDDRSKAVSMVRLADGEAGLFESVRQSKPVWPVTSDAWCYRYLMGQDWKETGKALLNALQYATVVGTPDVGDNTANFGKIVKDWDQTCSNALGQQLVTKHIVRVKAWFKGRKVGVFFHDKILGRRRWAHLLGMTSLKEAKNMLVYPFRGYRDRALRCAAQGIDLALVSGGPAGKILCVELQQMGIDALDIGQAIER